LLLFVRGHILCLIEISLGLIILVSFNRSVLEEKEKNKKMVIYWLPYCKKGTMSFWALSMIRRSMTKAKKVDNLLLNSKTTIFSNQYFSVHIVKLHKTKKNCFL